MNEYIVMLGEKTLKAKTKLASEFVREVVKHAPKAAEFGESCVCAACEDHLFVDGSGMYQFDDCYYVQHSKKMNHDHAAEVLERIGFEVEWGYGKIDRITWPEIKD
ncbi:hypothetical protein [Neisseria weaveri]|uniref:hypothetical protein n=1 Tax=Neisseria weaveri TaxID=28091 RepID=UPI000D318BB1|nr:hypothetical protein [Neisseria weaveri]